VGQAETDKPNKKERRLWSRLNQSGYMSISVTTFLAEKWQTIQHPMV